MGGITFERTEGGKQAVNRQGSNGLNVRFSAAGCDIYPRHCAKNVTLYVRRLPLCESSTLG